MGNTYINKVIHFWQTVLDDGIGKTGLAMRLTVRRMADDYYWNGTAWQSSSYELTATEKGNGNYTYNISAYTTFFSSNYENGYNVRFYDGTYVDVVEFYTADDIYKTLSEKLDLNHTDMAKDATVAKEDNATVNTEEIIANLSAIKGSGFNTTTDSNEAIRNKIDLMHTDVQLDIRAIEYDFTTYSKSVMLFYNEDRPFTGDPVAWCYIYTALGARPVNSTEIAKRDTIVYWSDSEPT